MFCPQCNAEYRAGFVKCSECGVDLVDRLPVKAPDDPASHAELVTVRTFSTEAEADIAKTALDASGIESILQSDNEGGQAPALVISRGMRLLVRPDDAQVADEILSVDDSDIPTDDSDELP